MNSPRLKQLASMDFSQLIRTQEYDTILELWRMGVESNLIAIRMDGTTNQVHRILRKLALMD